MKIIKIILISILSLLLMYSYVEFGSRFSNYVGYKILLERKKLIDVNLSIQSEKENNKNYWWLSDSLNMLSIINKSPENLKLNLKMTLQNNPCGFIEYLVIKQDSTILIDSQQFQIGDNDIEIPLKIDKFKTINLLIESKKPLTCGVSNGDKRKFMAKLTNLKWELADDKS
jgi:hypothetical protein